MNVLSCIYFGISDTSRCYWHCCTPRLLTALLFLKRDDDIGDFYELRDTVGLRNWLSLDS